MGEKGMKTEEKVGDEKIHDADYPRCPHCEIEVVGACCGLGHYSIYGAVGLSLKMAMARIPSTTRIILFNVGIIWALIIAAVFVAAIIPDLLLQWQWITGSDFGRSIFWILFLLLVFSAITVGVTVWIKKDLEDL